MTISTKRTEIATAIGTTDKQLTEVGKGLEKVNVAGGNQDKLKARIARPWH